MVPRRAASGRGNVPGSSPGTHSVSTERSDRPGEPSPWEETARPASAAARVHAVSVNYRTAALAERLLASLARERDACPGLTATIVDNASGDGSVERLRERIAAAGWEEWAEVLPSEENGGFAYGNNLGVRRGSGLDPAPAFHLLINPDCEAQPGMVAALLEAAATRPRAGYLGPYSEIGRGNHRNTAFRFPGVLNHLDEGLRVGFVSRLLPRWRLSPEPRPEAHRTDWLSGGCVLVRAEVFEEVGPMDEDYFLYYEEVDHMLAASKRGWECWYVPEAALLHDSGAATGVTGEHEFEARIPRYWLESRARYLVKNHGRLKKLLCDLAWTTGSLVRLARCKLLRRPTGDPPRFFQDFVAFNLLGRRDVGR